MVAEVARWTSTDGFAHIGLRAPIESGSVEIGLVLETRRPGRIDSYAGGPVPSGPRSGLAGARPWGRRHRRGPPLGRDDVASTTDRPLPPDTEGRLAEFTALSRPRSPTPRAAPSSTPRAPGSSPPPTRRRPRIDATCTTAHTALVSLALDYGRAGTVPPEISPFGKLSRVARLTSVLDGLREIARGDPSRDPGRGWVGPALRRLHAARPFRSARRARRAAAPGARRVAAYYGLGGARVDGEARAGFGRTRRRRRARPRAPPLGPRRRRGRSRPRTRFGTARAQGPRRGDRRHHFAAESARRGHVAAGRASTRRRPIRPPCPGRYPAAEGDRTGSGGWMRSWPGVAPTRAGGRLQDVPICAWSRVGRSVVLALCSVLRP